MSQNKKNRTFGKRRRLAQAPRVHQPLAQIIPTDAFDQSTNAGKLLNAAGMTADSPGNFTPTNKFLTPMYRTIARSEDAHQKRMSKDSNRLKEFVTKIYSDHAFLFDEGQRLYPFPMIPWQCWDGRHKKLLLEVLGVYPFEFWNILLLPGPGIDGAKVSKEQLQARQEQENFIPLQYIERVERHLDDLLQLSFNEIDKVENALSRGLERSSVVREYDKFCDEVKYRLPEEARQFAMQLHGEAEVRRSFRLFYGQTI